MIFPDRKEAKRVVDGKVTAVIRPAGSTPFTEPDQPVQWRRKAKDNDPAILRERQADTDRPVARETEGWVEIVKQTPCTLGSLGHTEARKLGHMSPAALRESYGDDWTPTRRVVLVEFVVVRQKEDRPTWMARGGGTTHDISQAIDDVEHDDRGAQRKVAENARATFKLLKAEEHLKRTAKTLGKLVREETIVSARAGVDISDELAMIERTIKIIQAKREGMDEAA